MTSSTPAPVPDIDPWMVQSPCSRDETTAPTDDAGPSPPFAATIPFEAPATSADEPGSDEVTTETRGLRSTSEKCGGGCDVEICAGRGVVEDDAGRGVEDLVERAVKEWKGRVLELREGPFSTARRSCTEDHGPVWSTSWPCASGSNAAPQRLEAREATPWTHRRSFSHEAGLHHPRSLLAERETAGKGRDDVAKAAEGEGGVRDREGVGPDERHLLVGGEIVDCQSTPSVSAVS